MKRNIEVSFDDVYMSGRWWRKNKFWICAFIFVIIVGVVGVVGYFIVKKYMKNRNLEKYTTDL